MKKGTIIWLAIAVVAVVGLSWLFIGLKQSLDTESEAVLMIANAATDEFEKSGITLLALQGFATPEYYASLEAAGNVDKFGLLGGVQSIADCVLFGLNITNGVGDSQVGCAGTFDSGKATLVLGLHKPLLGTWKISGLSLQI